MTDHFLVFPSLARTISHDERSFIPTIGSSLMRKQLAFIGKDWQSWLEAVLRNWKSLKVYKFPFLDRRHIAILTACRIIKWFHFRPTLASKCIPDFRLVWCCNLVYIPLDFCWNYHNFDPKCSISHYGQLSLVAVLYLKCLLVSFMVNITQTLRLFSLQYVSPHHTV